ncbi:type-F conjugative transfer system pilin assembly protein TrbC [Citrobacter sp. RHB35-C17]|uniref:type-F conjugative transfer system pilin assembly protein TrbC n=1 Tax=Citrobacter sp. RHB35-C17 TaxID=2742625 RepID=UPI0015E8F144|nr:type-F conjugative transfer system pilin assembly protein TrbC [Citrobacter sp. RHB35-C17]QMD64642.1 type-F conjugative transfer system pilin assembly protein TrbC [Citrobacter sp. RHB35-C17]HBL7007489.1 type-F conjugative transfer system pilin assembly protein TrbC [Citrobacter koseri]
MKRATIALFAWFFAVAAALANAPLSDEDAAYLSSLPDQLSQQATTAVDPLQGVKINDAMTQENADFIRQTQQRVEEYKKQETPAFLKELQKRQPFPQGMEPDAEFMQKLTDRQRQAMEQIEQRGKGKQQPQSEAYYFLSFSIPDEPIKRMISQASHYKIPATVRGLIENNMEKTTAKMFELVKDNNQGGVAIDPEPFKRFHIDAVPALVVQCGQKFDVVYGDISLNGLLREVKEGGDCSDVARRILRGADKDE